METVATWFDRRTSEPYLVLREERHRTEEWHRFTGRRHFARVSLAAYPSKAFEFSSTEDAWLNPESQAEFEHYILSGIMSELLTCAGPAILGLRVVVEATEVHESDSNGNAFYMAAKQAMAKILEGKEGEYHGSCGASDA